MIKYSNPSTGFLDLIRFWFVRKPENQLIKHFSKISGKKYILVTGSCRAALYLAYQAVEKKGEVIASPLTCTSALSPITESENLFVPANISPASFLMDEESLEPLINQNTIAIQAIHLGGYMAKVQYLKNICEKNNILLVEDCAQAYGASTESIKVGETADIACFSLIKNLFGLNGGILATDHKEIYEKAKALNADFKKGSKALSLYRLLRNFLASYPKNFILKGLLNLMKKARSGSVDNQRDEKDELNRMLKRLNSIELKFSANQIKYKVEKHLKKRMKLGIEFQEILRERIAGIKFQSLVESHQSSFVKFYISHPAINSETDIDRLNKEFNIEAKHLEHKEASNFQADLSQSELFASYLGNYEKIEDYKKLHRQIITLPIFEKMKKREMIKIADGLKKIIDEK